MLWARPISSVSLVLKPISPQESYDPLKNGPQCGWINSSTWRWAQCFLAHQLLSSLWYLLDNSVEAPPRVRPSEPFRAASVTSALRMSVPISWACCCTGTWSPPPQTRAVSSQSEVFKFAFLCKFLPNKRIVHLHNTIFIFFILFHIKNTRITRALHSNQDHCINHPDVDCYQCGR